MKKLVTFVLCVCASTAVFAQKPLNFFVSQEVGFDDNIYLSSGNAGDVKKQSSAISTTAAGADYYSKIPQSSLAVAFNGKVAYNAYSEEPSTNSYFDGLASAAIGNNMFNVGDSFVYTSDPANSEQTKRAKRIYNNAEFLIKTSANKPVGIGLTAAHTMDKYLEDDISYKQLNRARTAGGLQLYYNISSKTNVYAEYVYSTIAYDETLSENKESKTGTAAIGVNGQIAPKLAGSAKVTYASRTYDKEVAGLEKDSNVAGYLLSLTWKPTTQNVVTLSGERKMDETIFGNNRYFVSSSINLNFAQKIFEKLEGAILVGYENISYPEENPSTWAKYAGEKRTDNIIKVRPSLDYSFQNWLTAGVWYQFRNRNSNEDFDYASNKAGAYVKVIF